MIARLRRRRAARIARSRWAGAQADADTLAVLYGPLFARQWLAEQHERIFG